MNSAEAWEKVFKEEPLFKNHKKDLEKYIDVEKTSNYYSSLQTCNGYFFLPSPTLRATHLFCGILDALNERASSETSYQKNMLDSLRNQLQLH